MCFGTGTYGMYAYNMAHSIKHYNPDLSIHLLCDNESIEDINTAIFDSFDIIDFDTDENGRRDNCLAKIKLFERTPFDETLYLDVDGVCLSEIGELWNKLEDKDLFVQMIDSGKKTDKIEYSIWADNETIWDHFNLKEDSILPALQTSFIYFKRPDYVKKFFGKVEENYKNRLPENKYTAMWGKSKQHPDELYYSVTMAQLGILPDKSIQPICFPQKTIGVTELFKDYQFLSMYGAQGLVKPFAFNVYDRVMFNVMGEKKLPHYYKAHKLYKGKFAGKKK